jgi:hypothetical protein
MKSNTKSLLLLIPFFLLNGFIFAQKISIGPRGGVHIANTDYKYGDRELRASPDNVVGIDAGVMINLPIASGFSIQPEIRYIQKGYRFELEEFSSFTGESRTTYHYLEVPLLAKYAIGNESLKFYINLGPTIGYAVSGQEKGSVNGDSFDIDIDFDEYELKRAELSLLAGAGLSIGVGERTSILLDIRYLYGLTNLIDDDSGVESERNRGLGVGLGALFTLGE